MAGVRLEDGVTFRRVAVTRRNPFRQRAQPFDHAALPVDKSSITVKCQNTEIRELHHILNTNAGGLCSVAGDTLVLVPTASGYQSKIT